jgi:hypothetical protein
MSKDVYVMPIHPALETRREWEAKLNEEPDPAISFVFRNQPAELDQEGWVRWHAPPFRQEEAFELREEFFSIKTPDDALRFYQRYGPHQIQKHLDLVARPVKFSDVLRTRDFYIHALFERSIDNLRQNYVGDSLEDGLQNIYLWQNLSIELVFRQPMSAIVRCKDVEDALRATVFLDRLRGMPWKRCAREDCGKPFEVSSKRMKLYCSTECAHLQSVRDYNERKRNAKAKAGKSVQRKGRG